MPMHLSRRNLLRTAAGGVMALPLLSEPRNARAATSFPKRLIVCFSPNGSIPQSWLPTGTGTSFALGEIMAPLEAHKKDLIIVDNLTMSSALSSPGGDAHGLGIGCLLTATEVLAGDQFAAGMGGPGSGWPGGISVDQLIANAIGKTTKFASLEYTTKRMVGNIWSRMSYQGPALPVTPMDSPADAFDRVFGADAVGPTDVVRLRRQRKSILDNSIAELTALSGKLSRVDRDKVESHLAALRDIESRLAISDSGVGSSCAKPPRSSIGSSKEPVYYLSNEKTEPQNDLDIPDRHTAIRQMLVAALSCDLTRVTSVMLAPSRSPIAMSWLGIEEAHHLLSHNQDLPRLVSINKFYAGEIAKIIADLKAIPEGSGTVFDNTLLVWCNELGLGWSHSHDHIPFMLAGSAGGYLKTGQLVTAANGTAQNDLLVSICNAMGLIDVKTFGNPKYCKGPLPGLVG
jgi:hypothetical protein